MSISYAVFCLKKKKKTPSYISLLLFFLTIRPPHRSTLVPYTTLFRSQTFPERWLESAVRSNLPIIDASLLQSPVHGQVLTFAAGDRDLIDLLAVSSSGRRSEEHTSELQSHVNLVCRLLLEKKKKNTVIHILTSFLFNDTPTTQIYTRSLHDALPISDLSRAMARIGCSLESPNYRRFAVAESCSWAGADFRGWGPGSHRSSRRLLFRTQIGRAHV